MSAKPPAFDIDAAEAAYDQSRADGDPPPAMEVEELDGDGKVIPEGEAPPADEPPPGFKSYEDYIAEGGDPDRYVGKTAYAERYENIQDNKRLHNEVRGLNNTVKQTMDAVTDWQTTERAKLRTEIEADLAQAKEDEDVDGAIDAQNRLNEHDSTPPPAQPAVDEHPVISAFRTANPLIDPEHDDYNAEFNLDVEAFYNGIYQTLSMGGQRGVTEGQVKRALTRALKEATDLHGLNEPAPGADDGGESPRNARGKRGTSKRRAAAKPAVAKAEDFKINDPKNGRDVNAVGVADTIRKASYDQAIRTGKSEADATKAADADRQKFVEALNK